MKKAILIATVQSHIAQFHRPLIKLLKENGYEVHVAAKDNLAEKNGLKIENADRIFNIPFERSPFDKKNIKAYRELKKILDDEHYDIISCNTPVGGLATRLAARKTRKNGSKVFYMAHGFHFYKGAPKKNWLIYYPIEKIMARYTDVLITITREDYNLAKKKFHTDVKLVHGVGADEVKYRSIGSEAIADFKKEQKLNDRFVILCTGELNANKNQSTVIRAVGQLVTNYPEILLLLAGNGPKEEEIKALIDSLYLEDSVKLLGYHTDLEKYVNSCDLVVSASKREGLPLNIVEAMMCKKAVVVSDNRGHRELVDDGRNGYIVPADSIEAFAEKIKHLYENAAIRETFAIEGKQKAELYTMKHVTSELEIVYLK